MQTISTPTAKRQDGVQTLGIKILIVDDDTDILFLLRNILEYLGYSVHSCSSSDDALRLFKAEPTLFDLVITDLMMPQMYGDELARAMMEIRPDIPIILCTGCRGNALNKASGINFRAIVYKPFEVREIRRIVDHALGG